MLFWILKTNNYLLLKDIILTYLKLLLTKNYWGVNKLNFKFNDVKHTISFFGGLSMFKEIFINKIYQIDNIYFNNPPKVIVDVGANVGFYSLWCSSLYPNCKIYSYEPVSQTYNLLLRNVNSINKSKNNITPINKAVSNKQCSQTIYLSYASGFSSLINKSNVSEEINCIPLSKVFLDNNITEIDILKIDTEGSELLILNDKSLLPRIKCIVLEYHSLYDKQEIIKLLSTHFTLIKDSNTEIGILHFINKTLTI